MIDAIIYVEDFHSLVTYLNKNYPDMLQRDENNKLSQPPVVTGFARTPAVVNGNNILVYARLRQEELEKYASIPFAEALSQAEYTGKGTSDKVYGQLFEDESATEKYDLVYDRSPKTVDDGDGGTITVRPPDKFGVLA